MGNFPSERGVFQLRCVELSALQTSSHARPVRAMGGEDTADIEEKTSHIWDMYGGLIFIVEVALTGSFQSVCYYSSPNISW